MTPLELVLAGSGLIAGAALVALLFARARRLASLIAVLGAILGGAIGLWGAALVITSGWEGELATGWQVPGGALVIGVDPLSAFFLVPLFVIGPLCALYGRRYLARAVIPAIELDLLLVAMAMVVLARHALLFLVAWEAMTLLAYLLVTREHGDGAVRRAGWAYLIASHVAAIALFALFVALGARTGGALDFGSLARAWHGESAGAVGILVLALFGFGIKAGVIGLHGWLPEAHAAAPSHVSALMSGVLIKLGLYGLLRIAGFVSPGPWFGIVLMVLGVAGAIAGIALALYQKDMKRILAYSSVENIGIALLGLGLGFWARTRGQGALAAIAFGGGLLHIWNHAAMKGLLFLGAGTVVHAVGTREIDRMGGLLGRLPWTGAALIVGALAIAALPPLNGLTGEWLLYRALADVGVTGSTPSALPAIAGAAALALVGGLAALCFVRLIGVVLLGTPRGEPARQAHEGGAAMTAPVLILAALCLAAALVAPLLVSSVHAPLTAELGASSRAEVAAAGALLAPLVAVDAGLLAAMVLVASLVLWRWGRARGAETWGCGYAAPSARMQYTGSGFSAELAARVLPRWLRARVAVRAPEGPFPRSASLSSDTGDPVTRGVVEPFLVRCGDRFARLRFFQQGNVHVYLLYIVATAIAALVWVAARDWLVP
jgi:formate hydrogenlyase subunit 3/multisubunit Na+/H+ antiporter MnhD subunit